MKMLMVLGVKGAYRHFEASLSDNKAMNMQTEINIKARYFP